MKTITKQLFVIKSLEHDMYLKTVEMKDAGLGINITEILDTAKKFDSFTEAVNWIKILRYKSIKNPKDYSIILISQRTENDIIYYNEEFECYNTRD